MKKKLLFIQNKLICGGAENALFSLLNLLDKNKYEITVFVLNHGGEWEQKFRDSGIRVIHSYSKVEQEGGFRKFLLRRRVNRARKNLGMGLISVSTEESFDLIIYYHIPTLLRLAGMELPSGKIRYIHGDARNNLWLKKSLQDSKDCIKNYNRLICVSQQTQDAFTELTGVTENVCTCFNPIESDKIVEASMTPVEEDLPKRYICAVGRLADEKGFSRLIQIHKRLIDSGSVHSLVIVGDGLERKNLQDLICQLGVQDTVVLTGYRENPYPYMKSSLFTVCSSYAEGMPVVSMESLCLGVPVVSAVEQVKELFGEECCGIITDNDDASLEDGIRKMLTDTVFYHKALNGAQNRSNAFSAKVMVEKVEQIFDEVIKENG